MKHGLAANVLIIKKRWQVLGLPSRASPGNMTATCTLRKHLYLRRGEKVPERPALLDSSFFGGGWVFPVARPLDKGQV